MTSYALKASHRLQWDEAQECHLLLYPEGVVELDETAAAILSRLTSPISVTSLVASLAEEYEGGELARDVEAFLEEARERGWISFVA